MRKGLFAALFTLVGVAANFGARGDLFSLDHPVESSVVLAASAAQQPEPAKSADLVAEAKPAKQVPVRERATTRKQQPTFRFVSFAKAGDFNNEQVRRIAEEISRLKDANVQRRIHSEEERMGYHKAMTDLKAQMVALKQLRVPVRMIVKTGAVPPAPPEVEVAPAVPHAGEQGEWKVIVQQGSSMR